MPGLKIISLKAENIKRLKAVEINPEGNIVKITGSNESGKSSTIDSIQFALEGKDAQKNTPRPIRDGEKTAQVVLDLGEIVVRRHWTDNKTSYLTVTNAEGVKLSSPQKALDILYGDRTFDPYEFANADIPKQVEMFKNLLKNLADLDIDKFDQEKQEAYDQRTIVNREVKNLKGQLSALKTPEPGLPEKETPSTEIMAEFTKANEVVTKNNAKRQELDDTHTKYVQSKGRVEQLREELALEEKRMEEFKQKGLALQAEVKKLEDPDLEAIQERLAKNEETNRKIRAAAEYKRTNANLEAKEKESESLSKKIDEFEAAKVAAIKAAKLPVEGLGLGDEGVMYEGLPFTQASQTKRLSVSMAIGMALNPNLRILLIRDGSHVDSKSFEIIRQMAQDEEYQVWFEEMDESGEIGIYIEGGEVKAVNKALTRQEVEEEKRKRLLSEAKKGANLESAPEKPAPKKSEQEILFD